LISQDINVNFIDSLLVIMIQECNGVKSENGMCAIKQPPCGLGLTKLIDYFRDDPPERTWKEPFGIIWV